MSENGTEYTRTEVVKSQPVIDAYVRLMDHGMGIVQSGMGCSWLTPSSRREGGPDPVCRPGSADPGGYEEGEEEDPGPATTPQKTGGEGYKEKTKASEAEATHHHQCENGVARVLNITTRVYNMCQYNQCEVTPNSHTR